MPTSHGVRRSCSAWKKFVAIAALLAHFTNMFDAFRLLDQVCWCGYELTVFSTYNIFFDLDYVFPTANRMHTIPYNIDEEE
jgi:hypothetical protein